jgi:hypothetical protein
MCAPHVYKQMYESDDTLCASEATRLCGTLPSALDNTNPGVNDPAACKSLISGSCTAFLSTLGGGGPQYPAIPSACQLNPGKLAAGSGCAASSQCGAGLTCYTGGVDSSCTQYCGAVGKAGRPCGTNNTTGTPEDNLCDPLNNLHCVIGTTGTSADSQLVCRTVTYGQAGAMCKPGSDKQCDYGFTCSTAGTSKGTCIAQLQEAAACDKTTTDKDPCDTRLGLQCLANKAPATGSSCQAPAYVPVGASCGGTTNQSCSNYAYCNTSNGQCTRLAMEGQGCVANGCFPPYVCGSQTAGQCGAPTVTTDPTCTLPSVANNVCGSGTSCTAGQACNLSTGLSLACAAPGGGGVNELDCEDSSQCTGGELCCLSFKPNGSPAVKASCTAQAQCNGLEICRADSLTACGGATGQCTPMGAITNHRWTVAFMGLSNIGFCSVPSCGGYQESCTANTQCCSGSCDTTGYQECN